MTMDLKITKISSIIWRSIYSLKQELSPNDFYVLLFFVVLYNEELLDQGIKSIEFEEEQCNLNVVYEILHKDLNSIRPEVFEGLIDAWKQFNIRELQDNFKDIFEDLIDKLLRYNTRISGMHTTPKEVIQLLVYLADIQNGDSVYNPFSGLASIGTSLNENILYYGEELNKFVWTIGKLRLYIGGKESLGLKQGDSIKNWNDQDDYSKIITFPPFKRMTFFKKTNFLTGKPIRDIHTLILSNGLQSKQNKRIVCVLPPSFLFNSAKNSTEFRKKLVHQSFIETIILLPQGLLGDFSGVSLAIGVFQKGSEKINKVRMIDASSLSQPIDSRNKVLDLEKLRSILKMKEHNAFSKFVTIQEIEARGYNLSPTRYFGDAFYGTPLSNVARFSKLKLVKSSFQMKAVSQKDLAKDEFNFLLNMSELHSVNHAKHKLKLVDYTCILVSLTGSSLKPTLFKYSGTSIAISPNIEVLEVDEYQADPEYIIGVFHKEYFVKQLESFMIAGSVRRIKKNDFLKIHIDLPEKSVQSSEIEKLRNYSIKISELRVEEEMIRYSAQETALDSYSSLSHILGKPLLSIGSSIAILKNSLTKLNPDWEKYVVSKSKSVNLLQVVDSIDFNLKKISEIAEEKKSSVNLSLFRMEPLNIVKYIENYVSNTLSSLPKNVDLNLQIRSDLTELYGNEILVIGNMQKLDMVFDNLKDNAIRHAFVDSKTRYNILIEVFPYLLHPKLSRFFGYAPYKGKSYIEVKVSNTGKTFPHDFNTDDFKRKNFGAGDTINKGLGGYEVNEIIKTHNFGRDALYLRSVDDELAFPTYISFLLPIH